MMPAGDNSYRQLCTLIPFDEDMFWPCAFYTGITQNHFMKLYHNLCIENMPSSVGEKHDVGGMNSHQNSLVTESA